MQNAEYKVQQCTLFYTKNKFSSELPSITRTLTLTKNIKKKKINYF